MLANEHLLNYIDADISKPKNLFFKNCNEVSKSKEINLIHRYTVYTFKYRIAEVITFQYLH